MTTDSESHLHKIGPSIQEIPPPNRARLALGVTCLMGVTLVALVTWIGEWPRAVSSQRQDAQLQPELRSKRAAIAVRDHVNAFQKWGTKLFVQPTLSRGYDKVHYFTQFSRYDQQKSFIDTLRRTLRTYDTTDLFLFIHGKRLYLRWIQYYIRPRLRRKLRLVYNTGCGDLVQGREWLAAGAKAYVGHPGALSISPIFAVYFTRRWVVGISLSDAVAQANAKTHPRLLLVGRFSFGRLHGPKLWRNTKAAIVGDRTLSIGTMKQAGVGTP